MTPKDNQNPGDGRQTVVLFSSKLSSEPTAVTPPELEKTIAAAIYQKLMAQFLRSSPHDQDNMMTNQIAWIRTLHLPSKDIHFVAFLLEDLPHSARNRLLEHERCAFGIEDPERIHFTLFLTVLPGNPNPDPFIADTQQRYSLKEPPIQQRAINRHPVGRFLARKTRLEQSQSQELAADQPGHADQNTTGAEAEADEEEDQVPLTDRSWVYEAIINDIHSEMEPEIEPQNNTNEPVEQEPTPPLQESVPSQKRDTGQMRHTRFPESLYQALPTVLRESCNVLTSSTEKEVFLIGALGVVSGILPNVVGHYDGRYIGPNLYAYVLAGYGVGKGSLEYARQLGNAIHTAKRDEYERAVEQYEQQKQQYEKDKKAYDRAKSVATEAPRLPTPPPNSMLYVPANSSKTGLYQVLHENKGRLIIFETEGDTLADTLKQDYANFSDGLRKAFHHESISYFRRGNGGEYVEVKHPHLSLVLSSTFDQLKTLIPTAENGLFSRFLFYELAGTSDFKNVFDQRKRDYTAHFEQVGLALSQIYDYLNQLTQPLYFDLTTEQQERFLQQFQAWKTQSHKDVGSDLDGTINRLAVICFRVAMLFSVLRAFEQTTPCQPITCLDLDFDNALLVIESLRSHALSIWTRLPQTPDLNDSEQDDAIKLEQKKKCRELHKQGVSIRQIAKQVLGSEGRKSTVMRWIQ